MDKIHEKLIIKEITEKLRQVTQILKLTINRLVYASSDTLCAIIFVELL